MIFRDPIRWFMDILSDCTWTTNIGIYSLLDKSYRLQVCFCNKHFKVENDTTLWTITHLTVSYRALHSICMSQGLQRMSSVNISSKKVDYYSLSPAGLMFKTLQTGTKYTSWWFQPIWKYESKWESVPNYQGENTKKSLKPPPRSSIATTLWLGGS